MENATIGFGGDALDPDWDAAGRVHDWRNYDTNDLKRIWPSFSREQKIIVASVLEDVAGREHWD